VRGYILKSVSGDEITVGAAHHRGSRRRLWRLTLDHLTTVPLAGYLLRVLAWYGAEAIPRTLLNGIATPFEVAGALGSLAAYNMITLDEHTVTVHRLVQAVARTPDPTDPHRTIRAVDQARDQAATLLYEALSKDRRDLGTWITWRPLIPHIDALAEHATAETDTATTANLFGRTGGVLLRQGPRATRYLQRAIAGARRALGEDHPHTLAFRNDLASAYERPETSTAPSPSTNRSSQTPAAPWAKTTPTPWPSATTWPPPTERPETSTAPSPSTNRSSQTGSGCWAKTTLPP